MFGGTPAKSPNPLKIPSKPAIRKTPLKTGFLAQGSCGLAVGVWGIPKTVLFGTDPILTCGPRRHKENPAGAGRVLEHAIFCPGGLSTNVQNRISINLGWLSPGPRLSTTPPKLRMPRRRRQEAQPGPALSPFQMLGASAFRTSPYYSSRRRPGRSPWN